MSRWGPWGGAALLVLAVVFHGAVDASIALLVASLAVACWLLDALVRREAPALPLASRSFLALAVLTALSAAPLPTLLMRLLSPRAVDLASFPPVPTPPLVAWSLDPSASLVEAVKWAALAAVVAWVTQATKRERRVRAWSWSVVATSLVAAGLHAWGAHDVGLVNPNHVASLTLMGTLLSIGLASSASHRTERLASLLAALLIAAATLATGSRAGIASLVAGTALFGGWRWRHRIRRAPPSASLIAVVFASCVAAALHVTRDQWLPSAFGKLRPWPDAWRMALAHPWVGVGRGAFQSAFEAFTPEAAGVVFTHPENLLLQWACEWGLPVTGLLLGGVLLWIRRSHPWRDDASALRTSAFVAVVAVLLHDLADFGLEFAGVALPWAVCVGLASSGEEGRTAPASGRWSAVAVGLLLCLLGWSSASDPCGTIASDDAHTARACLARHPADAALAVRAAEAQIAKAVDPFLSMDVRRAALSESFAFVGRAQQLSNLPSVHLVASRALLAAGHRGQAIAELGLALRSGADADDIASRMVLLRPDAADVAAVLRPALEAGRTRSVFTLVRSLGLTHGHARTAFDAALEVWDESEAWREPDLFGALCAVGLESEAFAGVEQASAQMRDRHSELAGGWWCGSEALSRKERPQDALRLLDEATNRLPSDVGLSLARARALVNAKRPREAESVARAVAEPDDPDLAEQRARILYDALVMDDRSNRALAEARSIAAKGTRTMWRLDLLARALADSGSWDEAETVWREASRIAAPGDAGRLSALRRRLDARPRSAADSRPE